MDLRPRRILLITGDPPDQTDLTRPALAEGGPHDYRRAGSVAEARRQ